MHHSCSLTDESRPVTELTNVAKMASIMFFYLHDYILCTLCVNVSAKGLYNALYVRGALVYRDLLQAGHKWYF